MSKILIVDDEAYVSTQLEERLSNTGYEVVGRASSGAASIEMAKSLEPDLVLMDIVMPGKVDGIDAAQVIKEKQDIPVIFLTAYADDKFISRAKTVEPYGYMVKPFQGGELKAAIEVALYKKEIERRQHRDEEKFRSLYESSTKFTRFLANMINEMGQSISTRLSTALLDALDFIGGIEWHAEEFQNRTGITCELSLCPEGIILDRDRSIAILQIFEEALSNVVRHSHASRVAVNLKEKAGTLELKVRDNGMGITKEQISDPKSFGLMGMRERVHQWGGEVKISGIEGKGTTVVVRVPVGKEGET